MKQCKLKQTNKKKSGILKYINQFVWYLSIQESEIVLVKQHISLKCNLSTVMQKIWKVFLLIPDRKLTRLGQLVHLEWNLSLYAKPVDWFGPL